MLILRNLDANTDSASSTESSQAPTDESTQLDAKAPTEESSTSTDVKEPESPDDVVSSVAASLTEESSPEAKVEDEAQKNVEGEQEAPSTEEKKEELPPFHQHPRWQEKVQEVNTLKQEVDKMKPLAERVTQLEQFCAQHGITGEQFQQALEVAALINTDPAKALEKLSPVYDALSQYNGSKLPEDLQADVDSGALSPERAKEIAQLRAQGKVTEKRQQMTAEQRVQQEHQQNLQAIQAWDVAKQKTDLSFKPKTDNNAPDGKWEFVRDRFNAMVNQRFAQGDRPTPQTLIALVEQAYAEVSRSFGQFVASKKPLKSLTSSGSSIVASPAPKTADDVIDAIANGAKLEL